MLAMPSASALLDVWEAGEREHAIDRALTTLQAFTGEARQALASLAINRRDALLLQSRILVFGSILHGVAPCAECGFEVEIELALPETAEYALTEGGVVQAHYGGVSYRVPNSHDLAAAASCEDAARGEQLLRARCIAASAPVDEATLDIVENALASLCELTTIDVVAACPECNAPFAPVVDINTIFWRELSAYAQRLLDEVDALATRYGWSEDEILAMSDARRRHYLERTL